jgi:hypothetical protein
MQETPYGQDLLTLSFPPHGRFVGQKRNRRATRKQATQRDKTRSNRGNYCLGVESAEPHVLETILRSVT